MWKATLDTKINAPTEKVWDVLVTPGLWAKADPQHYKEVTYPNEKLTVGDKGKMKTEDSPAAFGFKVVSVDVQKKETVTQSKIPAGALTLTKTAAPIDSGTMLKETVIATGPFAGLFAKLFFDKQIKGTLPAQHAAIKAYVER